MTEENQKKLYDHYIKMSKEGETDIQRKHMKEYADEILKSFPHFAEKPKEEKPNPKPTPAKSNKPEKPQGVK